MTEATAGALLDAAEEAFAADGIGPASLRGIMRTAGVDPGAIHYHFGGREELATAVLDRLLGPLNTRRLALLDHAQALAGPTPIAGRDLIDALVRPDVEAAAALNGRTPARARLLGMIYLDPARFVTELVEQRFAPVAARFHPHLIRAAPHLEPETLGWRVRWFVFGAVGAVLADPFEARLDDADALLSRLVDGATGAVFADPHPGRPPLDP